MSPQSPFPFFIAMCLMGGMQGTLVNNETTVSVNPVMDEIFSPGFNAACKIVAIVNYFAFLLAIYSLVKNMPRCTPSLNNGCYVFILITEGLIARFLTALEYTFGPRKIGIHGGWFSYWQYMIV